MISVSQAESFIRENISPFPTELISLKQAHGHVLRESIVADRDLPPYNRITMDGIAIPYASWAGGRTDFHIEATARAGAPPLTLQNNEKGCIEVMTGTMLPRHTDCVIPYEEIMIQDSTAMIQSTARPERNQYIHQQGCDRKQGESLLASGTLLLSTHIAILASVGKEEVRVAQSPRVAIVSTGDELVEVGETIAAYQIRPSNAYGIRAALLNQGVAVVDTFHARDNREETGKILTTALDEYDLCSFSAEASPWVSTISFLRP